jgi:hypothetical protein
VISKIEQFLGRELDIALRFSVPTLNDLPAEMLAELRRLPPHMVGTYLKFHLRPGSEGAYEDFINDVVRGDQEPKTWGYRDVVALVTEKRRGAALTMSASQVEAMLSGIEGERWVHYWLEDTRALNRSASTSSLGVPGVLVRHQPYWWEPPNKEVEAHSGTGYLREIPEAGFAVAFRRWIARRVAWWVGGKSVDLARATPRQLAEAIDVRMDDVSPDGEIALAALIREAQQSFDPDRHVRGYIGPDAWYADPRPRGRVTGQAALDLHERLKREDEQQRAAELATERAAADARGKEPFDLETLERMVDTSSPDGNLAPLDERRARLEHRYYVNHPQIKTLAELALLLREERPW